MQFKVLISFFFAYIAAVQAAPVPQLPAGGAVDVPNVPSLPNVPAVANVARAIDGVPSTQGADDTLDGVTGVAPATPELGEIPSTLSVSPRDIPTEVHGIVVGLPMPNIITIPGKRQNLPIGSLPATDDLPNPVKAADGLPSVDGTLPGVGKRLVLDEIESIVVGLGSREVDVPAPVIPDQLPSSPAIPPVGKVVERQVSAPQAEVPGVEDIPNDTPLPTIPTLPANVVPRGTADAVSIVSEILDEVLPREVPQVEVPELGAVAQNLPETPSALDGATGLVRREVGVPEVDVPVVAVPKVDTLLVDGSLPSAA